MTLTLIGNQELNLDMLGLQYYSMSPLSNSPEDVVALHHTYTHTYTYTYTHTRRTSHDVCL